MAYGVTGRVQGSVERGEVSHGRVACAASYFAGANDDYSGANDDKPLRLRETRSSHAQT